MLVKTYAAAVNGLQVNTVTVETSVETGQQLILTGLGDEAVRESQSRIRVALKYCNLRFPSRSITINLSPANLRKEGSGFDLPMAIALLAGDEKLPPDHLEEYMMMGELGLDGSLKPIIGALPIAIKAREEGFKGIILPKENSHEAAVVNNLDVYGMTSLTEVIQFLSGNWNDTSLRDYDTRASSLRYGASSSYDTAQAPTIRPTGYDNKKNPVKKLTQGEFVDINTADTAELKRIPGIGSYFARRIVELRQRRQAFVSPEELLSKRNFPETALTYMTASQNFAKIHINQSSLQQLKAHPLINYTQATDILRYRRLNGNIRSVNDISNLPSFSQEQLSRLAPFLLFD
jgi:DNA uptake protein ComE-like DNA-binding protein